MITGDHLRLLTKQRQGTTTLRTLNRLGPKAIQCTQCGGALSLFSEQTQMITCDHCGSQLDASSEEYRVLDEKLEKRDLLFPIGMEVYHEDIKYKIIARMVFEGTFKNHSSNNFVFDIFVIDLHTNRK